MIDTPTMRDRLVDVLLETPFVSEGEDDGLTIGSLIDFMIGQSCCMRSTSENRKALLAAVVDALLTEMESPSDGVITAMRQALRDGGLLPAYTDEGGEGQKPILHHLLEHNAVPAMIHAIKEGK